MNGKTLEQLRSMTREELAAHRMGMQMFANIMQSEARRAQAQADAMRKEEKRRDKKGEIK